MNSWLDKRGYNDGRFGVGGSFEGAVPPARGKRRRERPHGFSITRAHGFKLGVLHMTLAVLSMIHGGRSASLTNEGYRQVAHDAFNAAFLDLTQLWEQVAALLGLGINPFLASVVEFVAVAAALFFALFAGLGAIALAGLRAMLVG